MRSLKGFKGEGVSAEQSESVTPPQASKYEGMSEAQLMSELMKNVSAAKSNGSFSADQLDEFVAFVSPNLDESSRKRLSELVSMIKG